MLATDPHLTGAPMHVGMITQWYDPEPGPAALPGALARGLVERGHEVTVLTGFPNYPTGEIAPGYSQRPFLREERDGVHVVRTPLYANHDASALRRILNYASFGASSAALGAHSLRSADVLYVNYSPITTALPMWAAQAWSGAPLVLDVADLWPDTMLAAGLGGGATLTRGAGALLHAWCNAMYSSASSVAHISRGVGDVLAERGVPRSKLAYVPKWANDETHRSAGRSMRSQLGIDEESIVLVYAGSLGQAQGLGSLIEAMRQVQDLPVTCLIAGSGTAEGDLRAASADLPNVRFLGRLAPSQMPDLMATADLSYVSLSDDGLAPITMPSKTQASMAAGVPLLASAPGDLATLVSEKGLGFVAAPGQPAATAEALRQAAQQGRTSLQDLALHVRRVYDAEFSIAAGVERYEALMTEAVQGRNRG